MLTIKIKNSSTIITLLGVLAFVCLYVIATLYYPGGSQVDANEKGFSWLNNYWCNLLNDNAINGQHNPAKPIALAAMLVLCFTLANFWYNFPRYMHFKKSGKLTIQISGVVAMVIAMFLFTNLHDWVINIASLFALIAIVGTFVGLYKQKWIGLLNWEFSTCHLLRLTIFYTMVIT